MTHDTHITPKFELLFKTHFTSLCYFAQKYVSDLDSCKEIVHTVFLSIWDKRETFDFEKSAKSYLFTSVYNRSMNHLRDQKKFTSDEALELNDDGVDNDHLEAAELESKIWDTINALPEKCREVFTLNRFDGKRYSEIAEEKGISIKTVETQISKALKALRTNLKDYIHLITLLFIKMWW